MLFEDLVRGPLRGFQRGKTFGKITSNPIRNKYQCIPLGYGKHRGLQRGQLRTDHASAQQQNFLHVSLLGPVAHQGSLHVSHACPSHHAMLRLNGSKAQHHPACRAKFLVAAFQQRDDRFLRPCFENGNSRLCGAGSFFAMSNSIDRRDQDSALVAANQVLIARFTLTREHELRHPILHQRYVYCLHFFTVTVVPRPGSEAISNSSIKRRTPGNPSPRLPEVEKPSRSAWRISRIPGPSSLAITAIPCRFKPFTIFKVIWPLRAYDTMLRANSEMAVAMSVASPIEKPSSVAISRPFWRATTMSWSDLMATRISSADTVAHLQFVFLNFSFKYARPSSKSSAVATPSSVKPSCTMANATSG